MRFIVTLSRQEPKNIDRACTVTIDADLVDYTSAPGFVMFVKDDESVMTFNASKIESVRTVKELK